jgi:uracil-DNA glycosylase
MSERASIDHFLHSLWNAPASSFEHVFDPWNSISVGDIAINAVEDRRDRLRRHLAAPNPLLLCVGEAPGYQGARVSGAAFTSEALLLEGSVPRIAALSARITDRKLPWREPSATIVWGALHLAGLAEHTILWNAFPWHPHRPGDVLSNRKPSVQEVALGATILRELIEALPNVKVLAIGQVAGGTLRKLGIEAETIRHPANGGATQFREGLKRIAAAISP